MITKKELLREIQSQNEGHSGYAFLYFRKAKIGYDYSRGDDALPTFSGWHRLKAYAVQVGTGFHLTLADAKIVLARLLRDSY